MAGGRIFKVGRTTGLTIGRCNGIDSNVRMELPPNSDRKKTDRKQYRVTQEHCIISEKAGSELAYNAIYQFSAGGDSGSWLFDEIGTLVGLLWGSFESVTDTNCSYFTPIELIITDIEAATGKEARLL